MTSLVPYFVMWIWRLWVWFTDLFSSLCKSKERDADGILTSARCTRSETLDVPWGVSWPSQANYTHGLHRADSLASWDANKAIFSRRPALHQQSQIVEPESPLKGKPHPFHVCPLRHTISCPTSPARNFAANVEVETLEPVNHDNDEISSIHFAAAEISLPRTLSDDLKRSVAIVTENIQEIFPGNETPSLTHGPFLECTNLEISEQRTRQPPFHFSDSLLNIAFEPIRYVSNFLSTEARALCDMQSSLSLKRTTGVPSYITSTPKRCTGRLEVYDFDIESQRHSLVPYPEVFDIDMYLDSRASFCKSILVTHSSATIDFEIPSKLSFPTPEVDVSHELQRFRDQYRSISFLHSSSIHNNADNLTVLNTPTSASMPGGSMSLDESSVFNTGAKDRGRVMESPTLGFDIFSKSFSGSTMDWDQDCDFVVDEALKEPSSMMTFWSKASAPDLDGFRPNQLSSLVNP